MGRLKVFVPDRDGAGMPTVPLPPSLAQRTELLRRALLADLAAVPGIELIMAAMPAVSPGVATDPARLVADGAIDYTALPTAPLAVTATMAKTAAASTAASAGAQDGRRCDPHLEAGIQAADAVWPLALESGGLLERLSHDVLRAGRILLGSRPDAVRTASSKLALARALAGGGVAAVPAYSPHARMPQLDGPWVVKPDDGAGCLHTRLFNDRAGALAWIRSQSVAGYVLQPYIAGKQGSLSMICCGGRARVLACNQERIAVRDNRFHALGSVVNGLADDDGALARLAQQVAAAVPGLWGYVGVDVVLTSRGVVVLDVNPRLTLAYTGLHASIGCNPAGMVLDLLKAPAALPAPVPPGRRRAISVDVGLS